MPAALHWQAQTTFQEVAAFPVFNSPIQGTRGVMELKNNLLRLVKFVPSVLAVALSLVTLPVPLSAAGPVLEREGGHLTLRIPEGVADVLLSEDGQFAAVNIVTFDPVRNFPARVVLAVDLRAQRVTSRISLPTVDCCGFPVFSLTSDGRVIAVGGADRVALFSRDGRKLLDVQLPDLTLNTELKLSRDGRLVVAGQSSGRITALLRGRKVPVWTTPVGGDLLDLTVAGDGSSVSALTPQAILVLAGSDGSIVRRVPVGGSFIATVASSQDGNPLTLAWKGDAWSSDAATRGTVVALLSRKGWTWRRNFGEGSFPLLQIDAVGRWVAIGDAMGLQGALISATGEVVWRSAARRAAVGVSSDGRPVIGQGSRLEIRDAGGRETTWRGTVLGAAHLLRLEGRTLAVVGSRDPQSGLADRVWFLRVGRN